VDSREDVTLGAVGAALRHQLTVEGVEDGRLAMTGAGQPNNLLAGIEDGEEGFLVTMEGISITLPHNFAAGTVVDRLAPQLAAAVGVILELPVPNWHRYDEEQFRYFFDYAPAPPQPPRVWLTIKDLTFNVADNPMEAWLERSIPLWLDEAGERSVREFVLRR